MKLHLGCGSTHIPGFVHVDLVHYPHVDYLSAVERLEFADDESADLIYASHVLEHFGRHQVAGALREWGRVLKPGGILRIAVPDFRAVVEMYEHEGLQHGVSGLIGLVCGGQRDAYDFHRMIFDEPLLTWFLQDAGFTDVCRWDWRRTEHTHIDDFSQAYLPHMDKEHGRLMSLNLEATKPEVTRGAD